MADEALDAVADERPFAGVHIIATAMLCATGATADELELARRLLEKDPKRSPPREAESVAGCFNRHMDAAIDSVNASVGEPMRVGRRARLAADLDRAGLVLVDRATIAGLLVKIGELGEEKQEALTVAGVCSMSLPEAIAHLKDQIRELETWPDTGGDQDEGEDLGAELLDAELGDEPDPSVND